MPVWLLEVRDVWVFFMKKTNKLIFSYKLFKLKTIYIFRLKPEKCKIFLKTNIKDALSTHIGKKTNQLHPIAKNGGVTTVCWSQSAPVSVANSTPPKKKKKTKLRNEEHSAFSGDGSLKPPDCCALQTHQSSLGLRLEIVYIHLNN